MEFELRVFSIVGQRGAPLLEPPGNTLASLLRAVSVGATMLEVDVRRTRDDVLVLDQENVHFLDGEEVPLPDRSLFQWRRHGGEWGRTLLTLDDALAFAARVRAGLMLDFKEPGTEGLLARTIRKSQFPLSDLLVAGAGDVSRRILRSLDPRIPLAHTLGMDEGAKITPRLLLDLDTPQNGSTFCTAARFWSTHSASSCLKICAECTMSAVWTALSLPVLICLSSLSADFGSWPLRVH